MLSSSLKTGRLFGLRLTCDLLRVTARRFLISLVGLSQSIEVETLMKSGECSLAPVKLKVKEESRIGKEDGICKTLSGEKLKNEIVRVRPGLELSSQLPKTLVDIAIILRVKLIRVSGGRRRVWEGRIRLLPSSTYLKNFAEQNNQ
ncbi:hypothetical protein EYC84_010444 [Monilinia fructicola]|uniref:Uncharacterized protein n=1 Tax=Monilinia fructicola TaxID=38448 RepID=A0A5M9JFA9_MONFR|nr:hypothetical protein EYC84_010444 [Monilinia fructicola]